MTRPRTTLPSSSVVPLALPAPEPQGVHESVSRLACEEGELCITTGDGDDWASGALLADFQVEGAPVAVQTLELTEADIRRAIVAIRVVTPSSIRDIEEVLPVLYGVSWSYGKIHGVLAEAEENAAEWLASVDLSRVKHVALDEMFSQGKPVLGGIDLDYGFLFALDHSPCRTGAEWGEALGALRDDQNLYPAVSVKDAGSGLGQGVRLTWPTAEERDDQFHAVYDMGKVARLLEQRAYGAIAAVESLEADRAKARTEQRRRSLGQRVRRARVRMDEAIERYDRFEALRQEALRLLRLSERGSGRLRTSTEVREGLVEVATKMADIEGERTRKLSTYLKNRAPGLASYLDTMNRRLDQIREQVGNAALVDAVVRAWQASFDVHQGGPQWDRRARKDELAAATEDLIRRAAGDEESIWEAVNKVLPIIVERHRASSAIENLNSVLRPYLVVQKGAHQGFLDLFRFYWNTRKRRWGRWKGTTAYEVLSGKPHADWLTLLGFPKGERLRTAV